MLKQRSTFNFVRDICWLLGSLGFGIALSGVRCSAHAAPTSGMDRLHANSNEIPGGTLTDGVLSIDLEIREAEWFPEDERGPSLKVFGLAERGKPAQVPGPLIRVRQNTTIHAQVHNLLAVNVVMHGLHARPGKEEDVLEIPSRAVAKDGADLPPEQALTGPAAFLIAPGETYDFHFRPGREGEMTLRFDLPLLKEAVTHAIHLDAGGSQ